MPLRIRVSTSMQGTAALEWLSIYLCLAVHLYRAKAELEKESPELAVLLTFTGRDNGTRFMELVRNMTESTLVDQEGPVFRVEET